MQEETQDLAARRGRAQRPDANSVNDLADSCRLGAGSDFADANGNGFADGCESGDERLQAFPGRRNGSGGGGGGGGSATPPAGPARDTTAPALSKLSAKPSTATRAKGKKKAKSADAALHRVRDLGRRLHQWASSVKGHKAGKKCLASAKKKAKACTLYKTVSGALRVNAKTGANTLSFAAKLGTKKLGAGGSRLTAVAIDTAGDPVQAAHRDGDRPLRLRDLEDVSAPGPSPTTQLGA